MSIGGKSVRESRGQGRSQLDMNRTGASSEPRCWCSSVHPQHSPTRARWKCANNYYLLYPSPMKLNCMH
eukprot:8603480-Alexandrium_andersonii.AAC.1